MPPELEAIPVSKRPSVNEAKKSIGALLPQLSDAVRALSNKGLGTNDATCDLAAGLTLGKLKELGYDARLNDAQGHVTVVVRTKGDDVIVDATLMQFFADDSGTDKVLGHTGGFVGTRAELTRFIRDHLRDWHYKGDNADTRTVIEETLTAKVSEQDKKQALAMTAADIVSRLFEPRAPSALSKSASKVANDYAAYARGEESAARSAFETTAFAFLRDVR